MVIFLSTMNNKLRSDGRGQFAILAAIIIAGFVFSLVITISQLSTMRQELSYEPIDEAVLAITSDFERCLTRALANATQVYNGRGDDINTAKIAGSEVIKDWYKATIESYGPLGVDITISPTKGAAEDSCVDWFIDWSSDHGVSAVYAAFNLDVEAYGLRNLAITLQKVLHLKILHSEVSVNDETACVTLIFSVWEEGKKHDFIVDLAPSNVEARINDAYVIDHSRIIGPVYIGQGMYKLQLSLSLDELVTRDVTSITLAATVNGIKVAARVELEMCVLSLSSDDLSTEGIIDNEGIFVVNDEAFVLQGQSHKIFLFPGQTINITFIPPENAEFAYFSSSGNSINVIRSDVNNLMIHISGSGSASIIALYSSAPKTSPPEGSPQEPSGEQPTTIPNVVYITFSSRELDGLNENMGIFLLILPDRTLRVFIDDLTVELLEEISEVIRVIGGKLCEELADVDLLDLLNRTSLKIYKLPVTDFPVPYNQVLRVIYIPRLGYIAKGWEVSNTIMVKKSSSYYIFSYMKFVALGDGTITAIYDGSRPTEWRVLYISPEQVKGATKKESFVLKLVPDLIPNQITPPLNNPHDKRSGNSIYTTPMLYLGKKVVITLYAKYTKQPPIGVKVTLGFYTNDGTFYEIGSKTISVPKSTIYIPYEIVFQPSVQVIPAGSRIALILERVDNNSGGTLHILCGLMGSRIELWQPWESC